MSANEASWVPYAKRVRLVRYSAFEKTFKTCREIDKCPAGTIIFVVGSSGVGKSALSKLLGPAIYGQSFPSYLQPFLRVSAENPEAGFFSSKYLINQLLCELRDPFAGMTHKLPDGIPPDLLARLSRALSKIPTGARTSEQEQRKAVIGIAHEVQCRVVAIDEANLMTLIKQGRPIESHLESIRTLAIAMDARFILFGTFMALDFTNYSAQINRIGFIEHLDRIRNDTKEGMLEFLSLLDSVEEDLALSSGLLIEHADSLYEKTYGIPGELISLLERARIKAALRGRLDIEREDIEAAYPARVAIERMRAEADYVEAFANDIDVNELSRFSYSSRRRSALARASGKQE